MSIDELRFAAALLHAEGQPDALREALRAVQVSLRASNASISIVRRDAPEAGMYVATEIDDELVDAYFPQMGDDPWYREVQGRTGVVLALGSELVPQREFRRSRICADFNRRVGLDHLAVAAVRAERSDVLLIANRSARRGNFDRATLDDLECLLPHAARYARLQRLLSKSTDAVSPVAHVDIDEHGLVELQAPVRRMLLSSPLVRLRRNRISIRGAAGARFERACALSMRGLAPPGARIDLPTDDGGSMVLDVLPLRSTRCDGEIRWRARVCIEIRASTAVAPDVRGIDATLGRALPKLTPSEQRLVAALRAGSTLRQHAEASSRSIHTVRSHMKNVLHKVGVRRQVDLVRWLAGLPEGGLQPGRRST